MHQLGAVFRDLEPVFGKQRDIDVHAAHLPAVGDGVLGVLGAGIPEVFDQPRVRAGEIHLLLCLIGKQVQGVFPVHRGLLYVHGAEEVDLLLRLLQPDRQIVGIGLDILAGDGAVGIDRFELRDDVVHLGPGRLAGRNDKLHLLRGVERLVFLISAGSGLFTAGCRKNARQ